MKLLLAFTPFHTPASPPFGLACLKGALAVSQPETQVLVRDWNLAFFRRWLGDEMPDLCTHHPTHLLGTVCPSLIVQNGLGEQLLADLTHLPTTPQAQIHIMQAARILDDFYTRLSRFYHEILFPVVEGRRRLSRKAADALFGTELAEVAAEKPDVVGFSVLTEHNLQYALALGQVIKQRFGMPIALGGAMMSHLEPDELLAAYPWLDFVFFGEAEESLAQFVAAGLNGDLSKIRGLACREGEQVWVAERPSPLNLSHLPPPDFSDYPLGDYITPEPVLPIITSRGCYWGKCAFCSHTRPYGSHVRVRQPEQVVDEMAAQIETYGVRRFLFVDEAISPRMMRRLSQEILDRGLDVQFGMEGVRVEEAFDEDLLRLAHRAGLRWIYVGIESANQRLLDLIEKGITIERVERLIAACRQVGVVPQLSFIVGLPSTTEADLQEEIAFLKRHPMDNSSFVLLLGSPMEEDPTRFGIRVEGREVLYRTPHGVVHAPRFNFTVTEGLSPVTADAIVEAAGPYPRMRPHLGEVHATLLADTDFFDSEERPPAPMSAAEIALQTLSQQRAAGEVNGRWFLHMLGCLEDQNRLDEAFIIAQAGLAAHDQEQNMRQMFQLHLAAALNARNRPGDVVKLVGENGRTLPALHGERARAWFALEKPAQALRDLQAMNRSGHEIRWMHYIQGLCYAQTNRCREALAALEQAEACDWLEPEINEAKARCLQNLNQNEAAQAELAKVQRKRRFLGEESKQDE